MFQFLELKVPESKRVVNCKNHGVPGVNLHCPSATCVYRVPYAPTPGVCTGYPMMQQSARGQPALR